MGMHQRVEISSGERTIQISKVSKQDVFIKNWNFFIILLSIKIVGFGNASIFEDIVLTQADAQTVDKLKKNNALLIPIQKKLKLSK